MWIPTRAAASAHWVFRCSVGQTTVIFETTPAPISSTATRSANVVFPAPGVATARKSRGWAFRYCSSAAACQARRLPAVPHAARAGKAGGSWAAAETDGEAEECPWSFTCRNRPALRLKMASFRRSCPFDRAASCRSGTPGTVRPHARGSTLSRTVPPPAVR